MILLAYLWPLALVPLIFQKDDPEVQWHARHGILLMAAELVLLLAYLVIVSLISLASLTLGFVLAFLLVFVWVGVLGLHVVAIIKGLGGGRLMVPALSRHVERL
jgi:hypothetical protein